MPNTSVFSHSKYKTESKAKPFLILLTLFTFIIFILIIVIAFLLKTDNSVHINSIGNIGVLEESSVSDLLPVDSFSYRLNGDVTVDKKGMGNFRIENPPENRHSMKVTVFDEKNNIIAETPAIKPYRYIEFCAASNPDNLKQMNCTAVIEVFDNNSGELLGKSSENIVVNFPNIK